MMVIVGAQQLSTSLHSVVEVSVIIWPSGGGRLCARVDVDAE